MKLFQTLVSSVLGGVGAIIGFGVLLSGCTDDDNDKKPTTVISTQDLKNCCGSDESSDAFANCVKSYQESGICHSENPNDPHNNVTYYGPAPVDPDKDLAACCGKDDGSKEYSACVENYKANNGCGEVSVKYGMPQIDEDAMKACCGDDKKCMEDFIASGECHAVAPVYGMPEISDEDLKACCGNDEECIADYKASGKCDEPVAEYGPQPYVDCCADAETEEEYNECVENYEKTGSCAEEPPIMTYYGPDPAAECCSNAQSPEEYKECVENYEKTGSCSEEPPVMTDYGMPSVDDELTECCGEDDGSETYQYCAKNFVKNGGCEEMSVKYGMPATPAE